MGLGNLVDDAKGDDTEEENSSSTPDVDPDDFTHDYSKKEEEWLERKTYRYEAEFSFKVRGVISASDDEEAKDRSHNRFNAYQFLLAYSSLPVGGEDLKQLSLTVTSPDDEIVIDE